MKKIYIYKLTDPFTDEIRYVGKTTNLVRRLNSHINRCKSNKFHSAVWIKSIINKGKKPIIEIIEECNEENWEDREIYWISYYRKIFDLTNILDGGGHSATYGRLGKPWTEEQRINNRKSRLGKSVNHTKEGNEKRAEGIRRYCNKNKKEVFQYDLDGNFIRKWDSAVDAGKELNISYSDINRACKKENLTAFGFQWRYRDSDVKIGKYVKPESTSNKAVIQLTKEGEKLKEFKSIMEASRQTGILNSSIKNCLSGRSQSAGGYKWKLK